MLGKMLVNVAIPALILDWLMVEEHLLLKAASLFRALINGTGGGDRIKRRGRRSYEDDLPVT